ncbi:MAG: hypothetical protein AAFX03_07115 [Pseudomonadota bacterium]
MNGPLYQRAMVRAAALLGLRRRAQLAAIVLHAALFFAVLHTTPLDDIAAPTASVVVDLVEASDPEPEPAPPDPAPPAPSSPPPPAADPPTAQDVPAAPGTPAAATQTPNAARDEELDSAAAAQPAPSPPPSSTNGIVSFPEAPPSPLRRALRATQCARLSASQRIGCPDIGENDRLASQLAAAGDRPPVYDPIWDIVSADRALSAWMGRNQSAGVDQPWTPGETDALGIDNTIFNETSD